jgi:hypothetical protein
MVMELPINLPEGWEARRYDTDCVTIHKPAVGTSPHGAVTVNVKERSFVLGVMRPRRTVLGVDVYRGRGWQAELFTAAVAALQKAME